MRASGWVLGAVLVALGLLTPASVASPPPSAPPVVSLTNGVLRWRLPESPELGWIVQHSFDLAHWEAMGDPLTVMRRRNPLLDLPFLEAGPRSFFRAVPADGAARESLLEEQWSRWKAAGLRTYEFEFRWSCFCVPEFTQWVRIAVVDGTLVSVRRVADGRELPSDLWRQYQTLDGLFAWLTEAFDRNAARIEVTYDAGLGYPRSGFVDYHEAMADEEMGFEVCFSDPPAAMLLAEPANSWPGDPYVIEDVRREGDWLQVEVAYSGGCVDPHGWELIAVPAPPVPETPRKVLLYLTHDARGDTCEAYLHKRLTFGLSPLRAWWAADNPIPGTGTVRLALAVQDPGATYPSPPKEWAVLDYAWDQGAFVAWRDVLTATSQRWYGGVFGSGSGTDYQITLRFPPGWGDAVRVKTLWVDDRAFTPDVEWSALPSGGGRFATLRAAFRAVPRLDPDNPGQVLGIDESPPRDPQAPEFVGAALVVTEALGQTQDWAIPAFHELPPLFYP